MCEIFPETVPLTIFSPVPRSVLSGLLGRFLARIRPPSPSPPSVCFDEDARFRNRTWMLKYAHMLLMSRRCLRTVAHVQLFPLCCSTGPFCSGLSLIVCVYAKIDVTTIPGSSRRKVFLVYRRRLVLSTFLDG